MDKCCGNCGHYAPGNYKSDHYESGVCYNIDSSNCADFVSEEDSCEAWEGNEDA